MISIGCLTFESLSEKVASAFNSQIECTSEEK